MPPRVGIDILIDKRNKLANVAFLFIGMLSLIIIVLSILIYKHSSDSPKVLFGKRATLYLGKAPLH